MKEIVIISGPTASGKSDLAIALSKRMNGAVISADSMQVYKGMDIGTAKLKKSQMQGVEHYLIDILDPAEEFNAAIFCQMAGTCIEDLKKRSYLPIIVGGTGFYIKALLYGAPFKEGETDPKVRARYEEEGRSYGTSYLEEKLKKIDPVSAEKYTGNRKRIIRALEYHELTGRTLSEKNEEENRMPPEYDAAHFCITFPRDILYERINERVDRMFENGLCEEAGLLYENIGKMSITSRQAIGYKQLFEYFDGKITLEEAKEKIKKETRHFAKRQLTWFRNQKDIIMIERNGAEGDEETVEKMSRIIGLKDHAGKIGL
ncbi:MAG: tRNA (adenosine(37)-N6)-dimethylallyltransferase MiaA [Lachnospiraceae bacterium]|nr:tRNA (adenosine(37)-N6)-dimethylallyltransferase MiaA [Lachnospiraceae bacterium]